MLHRVDWTLQVCHFEPECQFVAIKIIRDELVYCSEDLGCGESGHVRTCFGRVLIFQQVLFVEQCGEIAWLICPGVLEVRPVGDFLCWFSLIYILPC